MAFLLAYCWLAPLGPWLPGSVVVADETEHDQPSRSFQTERFLYVRNFSPASWPDDGPDVTDKSTQLEEALYDLVNDPGRANNVVDDARYIHDRVGMSDRLTAKLRDSGDPIFQLPSHATFQVHGWSIHLHDRLWRDHPGKTKSMLKLLAAQLDRVVKAIPEKALVQIRTVPVWINPTYDGVPATAEFHSNAGWLRRNGRDPLMEKSIELTNVMEFEFENTRMPMLMLHELAHAYHDQVLGFRDPRVRAAFEAARVSGSYEEVERFTGRKIVKDKAYAISNDREYFAESTEAYFGRNDFFPFTRVDLKTHDPGIHDLLAELWGDFGKSKQESSPQPDVESSMPAVGLRY